jgi:TolB-like protein
VPFVGRTLEEIRTRQAEPLLVEQLKDSQIPTQCLALLRSMLAPDPKDRPQSARELRPAVHRCFAKFNVAARARRRRAALAAAGTALVVAAIAAGAWLDQRAQASAVIERSIAVLPFENLSPNGEDTYFTVGMQDEITSDLERLDGLKVVSSQSTRSYMPSKQRNLHAIGRDLRVRYLLEGDVRRANSEMRVSLRLVDLRDSAHPWIKTYQGPMKDVFALESEITRAVAARLRARRSSDEAVARDAPEPSDRPAYDLYARALPLERLVRAAPNRGND